MVEIHYDNIEKIDIGYKVVCICGKATIFKFKENAVKVVKRGNCKHCFRNKQKEQDLANGIYQKDNKWCKKCSGCGIEQCYTRKDHASTSYNFDWQCKKCNISARKFSNNESVGNKQRLYNLFKKSAIARNIEWTLTIESMFEKFTGYCALTGWEISIDYYNKTASLDRIDSNKGYTLDNIQWVHTMVNMSKNKYEQKVFIKMCKDIAKNLS